MSILARQLLVLIAFVALPWHASAQEAGASSPVPNETTPPKVKMETNKGPVVIELYPEKAPETVANFLQYVDEGFYNGTIFHRVIPGFMVQAGQMTAEMKPKEVRAPIKNESDNGLQNRRGTLAMARTMQVHSATSQFFVNLVDNPHLDTRPGAMGYAVFGKVTEGMDVIDRIADVPTGNKEGHQNVPVEPVIIQSASRLE